MPSICVVVLRARRLVSLRGRIHWKMFSVFCGHKMSNPRASMLFVAHTHTHSVSRDMPKQSTKVLLAVTRISFLVNFEIRFGVSTMTKSWPSAITMDFKIQIELRVVRVIPCDLSCAPHTEPEPTFKVILLRPKCVFVACESWTLLLFMALILHGILELYRDQQEWMIRTQKFSGPVGWDGCWAVVCWRCTYRPPNKVLPRQFDQNNFQCIFGHTDHHLTIRRPGPLCARLQLA